uniref:Ecto-NOX disulfide-thiol exchanger 1/2 domain-containing protein n=1 Tax=Periophthalmus magnuspinnatus TaxID=409849 RepID=A0A3B3ZIG4_9GOBI
MGIRREEEMEMSDEEDTEHLCKRICTEQNGVQSQASLCEENDSLRWQLDAYRNEVDLLRRESRARGPEEDQALNQGLNQGLGLNQNHVPNQGMNQGLNQGSNSAEAQIHQLQKNMNQLQQVVSGCVPCVCPSRERRGEGRRGGIVSEREALLLGVMSTFLHVHPFGANLEYLWSYIQRLDSKVKIKDLERLMLRLPSMFRQELSGVGANLEKRWKFCGFDTLGSP